MSNGWIGPTYVRAFWAPPRTLEVESVWPRRNCRSHSTLKGTEGAGSFGRAIAPTWQELDKIGYESFGILPDLGGAPPRSAFALLTTEAQREIQNWRVSVHLDTGALYEHLPYDAQRLILTAATNDVVALLEHVDQLDGRSAAASARILFEHLINLRDVTSSNDNTSERFMDHRHVTVEQLSRRRWHIEALDKAAAKKESNYLDGLGAQARKMLAEAVAKYSSKFKSGWAKGSLHDRAKGYGLSDEYEGYRILSGVIHGSSGGVRGLVKKRGEENIHRLGHDMQLVPIAFEEGLRSYSQLCETLLEVTERHEASEMMGLSFWLLKGRLQEIREVSAKEDRKMWPKKLPPSPYLPSLAIWPSGKHTWYIRDFRTELMARADPVGEEPDISLELARAVRHDLDEFGGRPVMRPRPDVQLQPRRTAPWFPTRALLVPSDHPKNIYNMGFTNKQIRRNLFGV